MPSACCCTVSPITWSSYFASNCHRRCAPRKSKLCALSCSRSVRESVKPLVVSAFTWPAAGLSKISAKPPRFATPPNYPNCSTTHSRKGQAELSLKTIREIKKRLANRYEHRQPGRKPVPRQQWALCITISGPDELTRLAAWRKPNVRWRTFSVEFRRGAAGLGSAGPYEGCQRPDPRSG